LSDLSDLFSIIVLHPFPSNRRSFNPRGLERFQGCGSRHAEEQEALGVVFN
jgi:hypothetical protein